jgi:hypothetical protein
MPSEILLVATLVISLSACGSPQTIPFDTQVQTTPQNTLIPQITQSILTIQSETLDAIPSFTPLSEPCSTPVPSELNDFINRSITFNDNGKTLIVHVTSRFWIYLEDRLYPLRDLLKSIPDGLIGYVSNGSIRGPQCYPIMFEAVHEGRGLLQIKDFQLLIIVDNSIPESSLPLK